MRLECVKNLQFQVGIKNKTLQRETFSHTIYTQTAKHLRLAVFIFMN